MFVGSLGNEISNATHGVYNNLSPPFIELLTQSIDIDLDGVGATLLAGASKKLLLEIPFRHDTAVALHQQLKHRTLALR